MGDALARIAALEAENQALRAQLRHTPMQCTSGAEVAWGAPAGGKVCEVCGVPAFHGDQFGGATRWFCMEHKRSRSAVTGRKSEVGSPACPRCDRRGLLLVRNPCYDRTGLLCEECAAWFPPP